jgi:hypothetical protein
MLAKTDIETLQELQSLLIRYENNPGLSDRLAIMKEMAAKSFAFKIGMIAGRDSHDYEMYPSLTETEREYAEKYRQILDITRGNNQPMG